MNDTRRSTAMRSFVRIVTPSQATRAREERARIQGACEKIGRRAWAECNIVSRCLETAKPWAKSLTCSLRPPIGFDSPDASRSYGAHLLKLGVGRPYRCLRNKRPSKPFEFIGFGAMDVTKSYKSIWFGDIHGPKPYEFTGFRWTFISQTPVVGPAD